ncbi:MAG: xanthine dehydrogenase family protein molybdopterin-binding subunit [Syntrophobacteraceae bacterium]|nr:xanthine dehydrogenase family protein molybdopterin-binding subunit [Syntrophobacteraceae bacterium]
MIKRMIEVGYPAPRFDAKAKVTGEEKFAIDYSREGMLWAGARRAGVAHAIIRKIDISKAAALPGVYAVLTRKDVPGTNRQGIVHKDQPVLAGSRVRHCGDAVALVLAEDRDVLEKALGLIAVELEPLAGVFDPEEAMRSEAPLVHESGNLLHKAVIRVGDARGAFEECDVVVEDSLEVSAQEPAFLETQNGLAWQEPDGRITMIVSTQAPFRDRFEIAHALGLDVEAIRIVSPCLGGGFGGKDGATVQCLLALAALRARGRPVKMRWGREESFTAGYKRHPVRMRYRVGAMRDGTLHAVSCRLIYDTGPYAHLGVEVMALGMEHACGPYRVPNTLVEGWCVYTNNPISGAMRGFGVCQASFGIETMMDQLASKLGLSPLDIRLKNGLRRGDTNGAGVTLVHSTGIVACLEGLGVHRLWKDRAKWKSEAGPQKKRGVGIAAVSNAMGYGRGLPDSAIARVELTKEGKIRIYSGVPDMGQGNSSGFIQIAGQTLGQDDSHLEIIQPDTDLAHPSGSSSAGRTTYTYGNALIPACEDMKEKLLHRASLLLMLDQPCGLVLLPGKVKHLPSGREVPFELLGRMFSQTDRIAVKHFVMPVAQDNPDSAKEFRLGFPHVLFSYAAHLVYVEVDELTGKIDVKDYLALTDGGRVINPACFDQQVHGAVAQGLGYGLMEKVLTERGKILNPNFTNYIIPTSMDVPDITSVCVETVESTGPFGMKGIGEVGTNAPLPAVAAAVEDAIGRRLRRSPLTAASVLGALSGRGAAR